jgi:ornithine cyclodeaminase
VKLLALSADDLRRALPMRPTVEAMKRAFADLSAARATVPQRSVLELGGSDQEPSGAFLVKPAVAPGSAFGAKLLSLLPGNPARGLPLIHALVVLHDPETGAPTAVCEGGFLTAWRTGAAAGAATDLLALPKARSAAIFGAGVQARTQILAVDAVRPLETVRVYAPTRSRLDEFVERMAAEVDAEVRAAATPAEAVAGAEIVCAATTSSKPVFEGGSIAEGCHVNGVGSYTLEMREVDAELVARSRVFVDSRDAASAEAGDLVLAEREGRTRSEEWVEIGEVAEQPTRGRQSPSEITFFKSVGVAIQDLAAAQLALERARELGLGVELDL